MKIPTNPADIEEALFEQVSPSSLLLGRGLMIDDNIGKAGNIVNFRYEEEVGTINHTLVCQRSVCESYWRRDRVRDGEGRSRLG